MFTPSRLCYALAVACFIALFSAMPLAATSTPSNDAFLVKRRQVCFGGAEGLGAYTQGGRGGAVLNVTTLEDHGRQGSLRWAIQQPYPRIIRFAVAGTIALQSDLLITHPFLTIDGDSGSDGIVIKDGTLKIVDTHDIALCYLRIRPGDEVALRKGRWAGSQRAAPEHAIEVKNSTYVMIDHCSLAWSSDAALVVDNSANVTVQWCFLTESLANPALHTDTAQTHVGGAIFQDSSASCYGNFCGYHFATALQFKGTHHGVYEVINNYFYRYGNTGIQLLLNDTPFDIHVIGNQHENPSAPSTPLLEFLSLRDEYDMTPFYRTEVYLQNNQDAQLSMTDGGWDDSISELTPENFKLIHADQLLFKPSIVNHYAPEQLKTLVIHQAGANRPRRDVVDQRLIKQALALKGRIIASQDAVGGHP